jgi:hypothetical protein
MEEDKSFLDELLEEVEKQERSLHLAHVDMVLNEIRNLEVEIATNFKNTDLEKQYLDQWVLQKNSKIQKKIDWMKKKLENFMSEQDPKVRTIDLANGQLQVRKQKDKIQIENMDEFMLNADASMLTVIPESVKPDMRKVMEKYKRSLVPPVGTKLVVGEDKFIIKIKDKGEQNNGATEAGAYSESAKDYKTAV